ncbi:MAG TPA: sensor histidine kinase [Solirubrobacterales bacterium]
MFWQADTDTGVRHEALFYADVDELLAGALPYAEAGLDAGESVLVALPPPSRKPMEAALASAPREQLRFLEMERVGRNPARLIPAYREFVEAAAGEGRRARGIGEQLWAGRSRAELEECERHEALLNLAFGGVPEWSLLCPYNTTNLSDEILDRVARHHPYLREGAEVAESSPYVGHPAPGQVFAGALEVFAETPAELPFGAAGLAQVRRVVAEFGAAVALSPRRIQDVVLAANELATNSIRHGGGSGLLRIWRDEGALVCEVRDEGRFTDPLVGRVRPDPNQPGQRGLWIVNQTCDLVQIRSAEGGSVVRLRAGEAITGVS